MGINTDYKIKIYTESADGYLRYRDIYFRYPVSTSSLTLVSDVSYRLVFQNEHTVSIILDLFDTYLYFFSTSFSKDLEYDVYYQGKKIADIDLYYIDMKALLIDTPLDFNIYLYSPDLSDINGKTFSTQYESNLDFDIDFTTISINLYHPLLEYGFIFTISLNYPEIIVPNITIKYHYPIIEVMDISISLYFPRFIGIQDISLDGEPIPFMYGYENSLFVDNALILDEYDIIYEQNEI
jgi:hypothetical protein